MEAPREMNNLSLDDEKEEPPVSVTPSKNVQAENLPEELQSPSSIDEKDGISGSQDQVPNVNQEQERVSGLNLYAIMTAITLPCFLLLLDLTIIVTAIPRITTDFNSLIDVGWYGSAYFITSAALQPLTGKFYVNFSTKWTFLCFFAIFELGSLICGAAVSSKMLILGRAVAGMGASGILNGAFTIVADCAPMERRSSLIGFATGLAQLGTVTGPLIGGAITQYAGWKWCFYINLPVGGLVVMLLLLVRIHGHVEKPSAMEAFRSIPKTFDLIGFALFAPATVQLLLALQWGGTTFLWNGPRMIGLFCGSGATFIVFLIWESLQGDIAMIPFSLIKNKIVWSSCVTYFLFLGQIISINYYLPIYFQGVRGTSAMLAGVDLLPGILPMVVFAVISGILIEKVGFYLPFMVVATALVAIGSGLLSTLSPDTSTGIWVGYQIIAGAGRGLGLQIAIIAVQQELPPSEIATGMALLMFSQAFGGAIALSLCDVIFANSLKSLIPMHAPSVNPAAIITAGATGFRSLVTGEELAQVLEAYAGAVDRVFYFMAGLAVAAFVSCWFMGWKDVRAKKQVSIA